MINNKHQTEQFWEVWPTIKFMSPQLTAFQRDWQEHGTCYNTLQPSCLPSSSPPGAEAVAYFKRMVELFQELPTYQWLKSAGITPGTRMYDLDDVISAISDASGVRCTPS